MEYWSWAEGACPEWQAFRGTHVGNKQHMPVVMMAPQPRCHGAVDQGGLVTHFRPVTHAVLLPARLAAPAHPGASSRLPPHPPTRRHTPSLSRRPSTPYTTTLPSLY
eukprot:351543-Chlamydomonas_euryale.AAC.1